MTRMRTSSTTTLSTIKISVNFVFEDSEMFERTRHLRKPETGLDMWRSCLSLASESNVGPHSTAVPDDGVWFFQLQQSSKFLFKKNIKCWTPGRRVRNLITTHHSYAFLNCHLCVGYADKETNKNTPKLTSFKPPHASPHLPGSMQWVSFRSAHNVKTQFQHIATTLIVGNW